MVDKLRAHNAEVSRSERVRLVAADLPIDWAQVSTREDYRAVGSRSPHMGEVTVREVLARGRRALLLIGGAHLSRGGVSPSGRPFRNTTSVIEETHPGSLWVTNAVVGFGPRDREVLPRLEGVSRGSTAVLAGHFLGDLPAPMIVRGDGGASSNPMAGRVRSELFDAYIWLGPRDAVTYVPAANDSFADDKRCEELNRRSLIRFGRTLDPKTRTTGRLRPLPAGSPPPD